MAVSSSTHSFVNAELMDIREQASKRLFMLPNYPDELTAMPISQVFLLINFTKTDGKLLD